MIAERNPLFLQILKKQGILCRMNTASIYRFPGYAVLYEFLIETFHPRRFLKVSY